MRIGVNALRLTGQRLGIGRYIEYMLKHWDRMLAPKDKVLVYVREPQDLSALNLSKAFELRVLGPKLQGVVWEHLILARHRREMDVLFCPSYTMPLNYTGPCVVATHSVNEVQNGAHPWWYHLTWRQRYRLSARKADAVIVPSDSTKVHVEQLYGVPPEKIDIVPEGVDDCFQPVQDRELLRATRLKYLGADLPYVLFVGKLSQRRSIPALLEAFGRVKRETNIPHKLLLFGPNILGIPLEQLTQKFGIQDSVVQTDGHLPKHQEIIPIYGGADLFVHASAYEGFSLTICEAMACGIPVITVSRGAANEIAGGAAYMIPEPGADHIAAAMRNLLTDRRLHADVSAKVLERARRFRYEDTARGTLNVIRKVAAAC